MLGYTGVDNRHTHGGEIVSPTHRQRSTPQKHYFSASGNHFCQRLSKREGLYGSMFQDKVQA
jgi:hypothetical protein